MICLSNIEMEEEEYLNIVSTQVDISCVDVDDVDEVGAECVMCEAEDVVRVSCSRSEAGRDENTAGSTHHWPHTQERLVEQLVRR